MDGEEKKCNCGACGADCQGQDNCPECAQGCECSPKESDAADTDTEKEETEEVV